MAVVAAALWLVAWQLASWAVAQPLLLPGPVEVAQALATLVATPGFWGKVGFSAARITGGCVLAYGAALALASASHASGAARTLLRPPLVAIKSTPVACVVVLLLMWLGSTNVSMAAVFLMALPGVYFPVLEGLGRVDRGRSEMLRVHGVVGVRCLLALTWPETLPFLMAASETVLGMSWKAGVAAELIGMPLGSIGERIYQAKLLLDTPSLFAWTLVVIALASVWERACLGLLGASGRAAVRLAVRLRPRVASEAGGDAPRGAILVDGLVLPHGAAGGRALSLSVRAGGRLCLMGASGAGKTTLLRVIEGLERPQHVVRLDVPRHLSAEFQDARLVEPASSFENCALVAAPERTDAEIRALLGRAIPGLDPDAPVCDLSGGQRRRVELVRALVAPGDAVLLDEPFAGLDAEARERSCSLVLAELRGRSLVVATHDASDAGLLAASVYHVGD